MSEPAAKEPSMEDILSSIRKIIADEGSLVQDNQSTPTPEISPEISESNQTASEHLDTPSFEPDANSQDEPVTTATAELDEDNEEGVEAFAGETNDHQSESPSGSDAAKLIGSLASIAESVKASSVQQDKLQDDTQVENPEHESSAVHDAPSSESAEEPEVEQTQNDALSALRSEAPIVEVENAEKTLAELVRATAPKVQDEVPALQSAVEASDDEATDEEAEAFKGALVSPSTEASVSDSFDRLKQGAIGDMDAKAEAILRPMLREWMDENLPSLVEKLVRDEIERIARDS